MQFLLEALFAIVPGVVIATAVVYGEKIGDAVRDTRDRLRDRLDRR